MARIVAELIEAEVAPRSAVRLGQRTPERWPNATATELDPARLGSGSWNCASWLWTRGYFPSFLKLRRRAEQALVAVVQEAYLHHPQAAQRRPFAVASLQNSAPSGCTVKE
jgi:hypothetical protein